MLKNFILVCILINLVYAKDQILVLSGGDNPGLNHYSQYLQTKTIYEYLSQKYDSKNVSIYFGMGNNQLTTSPTPDVHQIIMVNAESKIDHMKIGLINNNRSATKNNIYQYFYSLNNMTKNDVLRLFISDHGLPDLFMQDKSNKYSNNCIDLWNFKNELVNNFADQSSFRKVCLSKDELSNLLNMIPAKYIVFEMSQCYSGGFHQLSVKFKDGYPTANTRICGFSAATEDHYASGCTGDANGPTYQGYERYFTEWFTGISIPTGKRIRQANTMLKAHQNAILEDKTVDTPITTSDYYLLQWAILFQDKNFTSRVSKYSSINIKQIFNNYQKYLANINNPDLKNFIELTNKDQALILKKYPSRSSFVTLDLLQEKDYLNKLEQKISINEDTLTQQNLLLFNTLAYIIYPQWKLAIQNNEVKISDKEKLMEKDFYSYIIDKHLLVNFWDMNMLFLQYLAINNNDNDLIKYHKNRLNIISKWAKTNKSLSFINALNYSITLNDKLLLDDTTENLEREKQLLRRIYIYKNIIAAWTTLEIINDKLALNGLSGLLECQKN